MRVLVTSASRKVSLVRAFQRALKRGGGGGAVIAVDIQPDAPALYAADRHFLVPRSTDPGFIGVMLELCARERVGLLVPTRDEELPLFAAERARFEAAGVHVLVPPLAAVQTCQDKRAFLAFCAAHGFSAPRTFTDGAWRNAPMPLFVKPRFGKGAQGVRRVASLAELESRLQAEPDLIVQECVDAPEYTVDVCADFAGRVLTAVPRLRQLVIAGESYVSRTVRQEGLMRESVRLSESLGLTGHNTVQCFLRDDRPLFIEINPRFGGAAALGIAAGADSPDLLLRLLRGERVEPRIGDYTDQLTMLRYTEDLFLPPEQRAQPSPPPA